LGITGRDQVAEHDVMQPPTETTGVEEIMDLGFGRCKLQVQVPAKGSIEKPEQLVGKNVVTSFTNLSKKYFADLEATVVNENVVNGIEEKPLRTNIKYVGGSVEAACALGIADGVVDLVGENCLLAIVGQVKLTLRRIRRDYAGRWSEGYLDCVGIHCCSDQEQTSFKSTTHRFDCITDTWIHKYVL
jgi:hypothetical protein